jgi:hypothetical protein
MLDRPPLQNAIKDMHAQGPRIITFSRRTDPAFFAGEFKKWLNTGYVDVPNPFSGRPYRVSLARDDIALITFWTRNPFVLTRAVDECARMDIPIAFFITATGYPEYIEPYTPSIETLHGGIDALSERLSSHALFWRYDPVIFTERMDRAWHLDNFKRLCGTWSGKTERVIFSLAHIDGPYIAARRKLERACAEASDALRIPPLHDIAHAEVRAQAIDLFAECASVAAAHGIPHAEVCCSPELTEDEKKIIPQGSCLSRRYLERITPLPPLRQKGTRKGMSGYAECSCLESVDIGVKESCRHGCVYCYANRNRSM